MSSGKLPPATANSPDALRILAAADGDVFCFPDYEQSFDRDQRDAVKRRISESNSPFADYAHHRLIHVLDALASLLVSQSRGEVVAVGYVPTEDDRVVLCLGENGSPDLLAAAEKHLRHMWSVLQNIRQEVIGRHKCENTSDESDLPPNPTKTLYQICYSFSMDRIKRHYNKATDNNMLNGLNDVLANKKAEEEKKNEPDPVPSSPGKRPRVEPPKIEPSSVYSPVQWQLVEALKDVIQKYEEYAYHGGKAKPWMEACSDANDVVRALNNNLGFLDDLLWSYMPGSHQQPSGDRYQRLAEKLLAVDASIRQLLILPCSASFGKALDKSILDIQRAPSEVNHLTYNFKTDQAILDLVNKKRFMTSQTFLSRLSSPINSRVYKYRWAQNVHAECTVLSHFASNATLAYHYIGVSRLSCVGCWLYFEAYNEVAEQLSLNPYYTRGSHTKVYPWVPPSKTSHNPILNAMKSKAEVFFNKLVPRERIRPRTLSKSNAASVSASRTKLDWEKSGDMDIPAPA